MVKSGTKRHCHAYRLSGWSGVDAYFRCRCGDQQHRYLTPAGKKLARAEIRRMMKDGTHDVPHAFERRFMTDRSTWRWTGYEMMKRVEKWADGRAGVTVLSCDDDYHAGSTLVVIEHATERSWMGLSVIYIPQCTGEKPIRLFLYPDDAMALMLVLRAAGSKARRLLKLQRADTRERDRRLAAALLENSIEAKEE